MNNGKPWWRRLPKWWLECVYCGREARTQDHIRPINRGGQDIPSNIVPACGPCNSGKHSKLLTEWDPVKVGHAVSVNHHVRAEWDELVMLQRAMPLIDVPMRRAPGLRPARERRDLLLNPAEQTGQFVLGYAANALGFQSRQLDGPTYHGGPFHPGDPFGSVLSWLWDHDRLPAKRTHDAVRFFVRYMLALNSNELDDPQFRHIAMDDVISGTEWAWPMEFDSEECRADYGAFAKVARRRGRDLLMWEMGL
jgi:hypothetical protein